MTEVTLSTEIMNMLAMALKKEENSYNFYTKAIDLAALSNIKDLFKEMAAEEQKHKDVILGYIEELKARGKEWNPTEDLCETEEVGYSKYLVKTELSEDTTLQEALIIALKREERAYVLFENFYTISKDEGLKNLFKRLMDDELNHLKRLEMTYDELVQSDN